MEEGVNITLSCEADGKPPPVYNWTTDGQMLENTNNPALTITEVNVNATYTCTASNHVGIQTKQIYVYVKKKITLPVLALTTPAASEPQNGMHPCVHLFRHEICITYIISVLVNLWIQLNTHYYCAST